MASEPSRRKDSSKDSKEIEKCGNCLKLVKEKEKGIQCELCDDWFHAPCVDLPDEAYKLLGKLEAVHWFCQKCNGNFRRVFSSVTKLETKVDKLEGQLIDIKTNVKGSEEFCERECSKVKHDLQELKVTLEAKLADAVNSVRAEVDTCLNKNSKEISAVSTKMAEIFNEQETSWNEVVKKEVDRSLGLVSEDIEEVQRTLVETRAQATEQIDKESRRNNIILYKVPESDKSRAEDRNKDDVAFSLQLFNNSMQLGISDEDLIQVFRLGRRDDDVPRPLMIHLASYTCKNLIMESLYKLKHADMKFKRIIVAHDMTRTERDECKKLVAEAKSLSEQDNSGEYLYRVRGKPGQMRVIKIKQRQQ